MTRIGGKELSATYSCQPIETGWEITFESRSGRRGGDTARNTDYKQALATILQLLAAKNFVLVEVLLASSRALALAQDQSHRRLNLDPWLYPVVLAELQDVPEFSRHLQKQMARMFSTREEPGGGNREKRITLIAQPTTPTPSNLDLNAWLASGREPHETSCWMEITDRSDIGIDLHAPSAGKEGQPHWSYDLVREIREGDTVFHYDTKRSEIVGFSRVIGQPWPDNVVWAARGTASRSAGIEPHLQDGWYRALHGFTPIEPPLSISEIQSHSAEVFDLRNRLAASSGGGTKFPFVLYGGKSVRAFQAYLTPFPEELCSIFPRLASAPIRSSETTIRFGQGYRRVQEAASVSRAEPFSVDPALIERGLRGHRSVQNALADFVNAAGFVPRSPQADDPPFDLLWETPTTCFVVEVKSITPDNEESQLRLGLGQVLKYRHILASRTDKIVCAVLAVELRPSDPIWSELCQALGVILLWPPFAIAAFPQPGSGKQS